MSTHALLSPSSMSRRLSCVGSMAMEYGEPDTHSEYADEGTAAHFLAEQCLNNNVNTDSYLRQRIQVNEKGVTFHKKGKFLVDDTMAEFVQVYIDLVRELAADGEGYVEQRLDIEHITGEAGAKGTADAVIVSGDTLIVVDLKYGQGARVSAHANPQLRMYAIAALHLFGVVCDFTQVRLIISQPRVSSEHSEEILTVEELLAWGVDAKTTCLDVWTAFTSREGWIGSSMHLSPSEDACRYCKAAYRCPALAQVVQDNVAAEFTNLDTIDPLAEPTPDTLALVGKWLDVQTARIAARLEAGEQLLHWKLVQGRRGARSWSDERAVEEAALALGVSADLLYTRKFVTPPAAETTFKKQPEVWAALSALIVQPEGKPAVAPITDKRPALTVSPPADEFGVIQE